MINKTTSTTFDRPINTQNPTPQMIRKAFCLAAIAASVLAHAQASRTLVVNGQSGHADVIERNGHSYVDVEALARLTNGSLTFKGSQIVLTLPASSAASEASAATPPPPANSSAPTPPVNSAFSKEFLNAGAEEVAAIRAWRGVIADATQNGYPISTYSVSIHRVKSIKGLHLAFVAASTDADRNSYQLLSNELNNMQKLSDKMVAAHDNMQNITADSLRDDPLNVQVMNCAKSLVAMAASGQFQDDGSCH
jgi:hypothetical protein